MKLFVRRSRVRLEGEVVPIPRPSEHGLDDSNVRRNINPPEPLLAQIFCLERRRIDADEEEIEALFLGAIGQPIQRSSSKKPRREYYSGKQKEHRIRHQIAIDETGKSKSQLSRKRPR